MRISKKVPSFGFILEKWDQIGYRATAHAYLKREKLDSVKHQNGEKYTLKEIENAMINS